MLNSILFLHPKYNNPHDGEIERNDLMPNTETTVTTLQRLKLEFANKEYFTDQHYAILLSENALIATNTYNKATMQRNLLLTVLDILNTLSNDIDTFRTLESGDTGFTQSSAYALLSKRIEDVKQRIATIPLASAEQYSDATLLFTRSRRRF